MQLLPRPSLSRRSTASYADLVFSCPASNSDSGDPRDVWQNEDRAKDASWSSSVSAVYASVSSASVQSAASALVAVVEAGEGSETETATVSQRARVRRDEGTSPGKRTQGGGCTASVEELTGMGQGWFEGAVGLDFGVYGCNLTDSTGSSSITWHSAYATTDDYSAILCVWTSLDQDLTYTASIVNSPVGTTGHGAIWLGTAGFRYSENGAATGLFTATGPQMSTVSAPPSSLFATATDAGSTTAASSSTSADSPSSSSAATSSTSDSSSTFPFSGTTWLWLALLSLGCLACLAVGCLCFRTTKPGGKSGGARKVTVAEDSLARRTRRARRSGAGWDDEEGMGLLDREEEREWEEAEAELRNRERRKKGRKG